MQVKSVVFPIHLIVGCLFAFTSYSQDKNKNRFGKVEPKDFEKTTFELDTSAHAVILADVGTSEFEMARDHFEIRFKRTRRVKIVDDNGYDAAKVEIPLIKSGQSEERLLSLKAVSYNLENGKVVETKMDSKSVFTDELVKNYIEKKFTLPAVKAGTIIEYTYSVSSPFVFNLQPWVFQDEYPCLWSEYSVTIPEYYDFVFLRQGYQSFVINGERSSDRRSYEMSYELDGGASRTQHATYTTNVATTHWATRDVPALKEENYTTTLYNHISKIEFQLASIKYPDSPIKPVMSTWPKLYEDLNKKEDFGASLDKNNGYLSDVVDELTAGLSSDTAKARRIYNYVRQNFSCTIHSGLYLTKSLKTVFTSHNGNETDLNLLLVAMLRRAKLDANPVILSTRQHGLTYEMYPIINRFNYTIASVNSTTGTYFMDASLPYLGFGRLDSRCYNGHARILSPEIPAIRFDADSLQEKKTTYIMLMGENGVIKGHFEQRPTYMESCDLRETVKTKGKEEFFKPVTKSFAMEATVSNTVIEDLDDYEIPVKVSYDFEMKPEADGMLYINPMFSEATLNNPFKSQERFYPVEMPYVIDELYTLNMTIPEGFEVEELPKPAIVQLNETDGVFQYLIQRNENQIQFRSRIKLARATFNPDEYNLLRDFYDMIVKKQAEQIVLKKK
ncbi:protein of unknown function [Chitinophaga sp. CF118]|uniref:transglutaminase domain-containing protein n=1 Tax=Chitinophaga sp. CF118 TaxID=1884367 RepID=UPI0008EFB110|nr:transglutaminase domain-containing protein [Chitinophaga sp. CF118]SFE54394.1 protein of unknown function [Chitinophaga sp. CF118]